MHAEPSYFLYANYLFSNNLFSNKPFPNTDLQGTSLRIYMTFMRLICTFFKNPKNKKIF